MSTELETLRWQFELTQRLASHHLPGLTDEACLWAPAANAWTVRRGGDGAWRPDWAAPEPSSAPAVTIGWLTWHLLWWGGGFVAALSYKAPPARDEVFWPGDAARVLDAFQSLTGQWRTVLDQLSTGDLGRAVAYPWPEPRPLRLTLAWANAELMKNVAEIGALRVLFQATR